MQRNSGEVPKRWFEDHLPQAYIAIAVFMLTALCLLTPPFFVADESSHAERALEIANGSLLATAHGQRSGALLDKSLPLTRSYTDKLIIAGGARARQLKHDYDGRVNQSQLAQLQEMRWSHQLTFAPFPNTAVYPDTLYLPQALGWYIGESFNWTVVHSLWLARGMNSLCAMLLGYLALRLAGRERWFIFIFLLLPTILSLNASCSQDGLLLPLAALATVVLARAMEKHRVLSMGELLLTSTILAVCIGARIPYLPLALLLFLPILELEGRRSKSLIEAACGVLAITAVVAAWQLVVHPLGIAVAQGAQPAVQTAWMLHHPLHVAAVLAKENVRILPGLLYHGMYLLGSNDAGAKGILHRVMMLALLMLLAFAPKAGLRRWRTRLMLIVSLLLVTAAVSLAEYVIWNVPGASRLEGLQARYYLPLAPAAFLLLSERWLKVLPWSESKLETLRMRCLNAAAVVYIAVVFSVPWVTAHRFYDASLGQALKLTLR